MKIIPIEDAKPGQIVAQEINRGDGVFLLGQGTEISETLLRMLKGLNIEAIAVKEDGQKEENERKKVLLVDDNMTNLTTGKEMLKNQYKVYPAPSAEIMFDMLENLIPDMILLDIEMPEMNGYEAIKRLKSEPKWAGIPVIFLTSKTDEGSELEGLILGAIDYVTKPFSAQLLLQRIKNHITIEVQKKQLKEYSTCLEAMVQRKTSQVFNLQNSVLSTIADLIEFRDGITGGHGSRSQQYLKILVDKLVEEKIYSDEISNWDMSYLLPSAQLHDVGKIAISDLILNKPEKLAADEITVMKTHVAIGVDAIKKIEQNTDEHAFLRHARRFIAAHHEKWDGSGYPSGLSGQDIPLEGRLIAIADVYDALTSIRPYKKPTGTEAAARIIEKGRGAHFDPVLVDVFLSVADKFAAVARGSW